MVQKRARPPRERPQYRDDRGNPSNPETISVFRTVNPDDSVRRRIPLIQTHVEARLREQGVEGVERIAVDALRMTLLPIQSLEELRARGVNSLPSAQKAIAKELPEAHISPKEPTPASRGVVLRGWGISFAAFLFPEMHLLREQAAVHEAVGLTWYKEELRVPSMAICTFPDIDSSLAARLNADLTEVAPLVRVPLGPIFYDIRGHH